MIDRREWLRLVLGGAAVAAVTGAVPAVAMPPVAIAVYKDPGCGCCQKWVEHLAQHGFKVTAHDTSAMDEVKANFRVPAALQSCHTAAVGAYVFEGHVPADLIQRVLKERPAIKGLAVPGMPMGSPGMEGPRKDAYQVLAFDAAGKTRVYATR